MVFACTLVAAARMACAQQVDFAVGGSTVWSPQNTSAAIGFLAPAVRGGVYPSATLQYVSPRKLGLNAEFAFRDKRAIYNGFQPYRPFLYDVNAVYAPRLADKISGDFMAGVGGQTVLFYNEFGNCNLISGGCITHLNSTHLLFHVARVSGITSAAISLPAPKPIGITSSTTPNSTPTTFFGWGFPSDIRGAADLD